MKILFYLVLTYIIIGIIATQIRRNKIKDLSLIILYESVTDPSLSLRLYRIIFKPIITIRRKIDEFIIKIKR